MGSLSIVAGTKGIEVAAVSGDTIGTVIEKAIVLLNKAELRRRVFPKSGGSGVTIMLNNRSCGANEKVQDKDEICVLPPMSGG